jgi:hypothetical protein
MIGEEEGADADSAPWIAVLVWCGKKVRKHDKLAKYEVSQDHCWDEDPELFAFPDPE